ncbi:MAG: DUF4147 domain-containing protein [Acidobacteria bacterium]|nr:DUF4147 domain-containing protein [Acidobacteriota bacterium]
MTTIQARELCRELFLQTLDSLKVAPRLRERISVRGGILKIHLPSAPLRRFQNVRIVACGKAALEMATSVIEILAAAEPDTRGVVVAPHGANQPRNGHRSLQAALRGLQYFEAGHPYPDERSLEAAAAILHLLENCTEDDLVLFLISGGGSSLVEKPIHPSILLADLRRFYEVLVTCGAGIQEINILRKHFSAVKGGRLAQRAVPATQVTLYVSDVPERFPSAVASGPTMADESTIEDCRRIATQYDLRDKFPASVDSLLESGRLPETPKPGDICFAQSSYDCLLSNCDGINKLLELARARGIYAEADASCDDWRYDKAADYLLSRVEALRQQHPDERVLLVSGGEVSSPVPAGCEGRGGRNQAFVLYCVPKIAGKNLVVVSAGTDGVDGNSPSAGAVADGESAKRAAALGLAPPDEFLSCGDSYAFFEKLGDTIITGPTGTNVRDLRVVFSF